MGNCSSTENVGQPVPHQVKHQKLQAEVSVAASSHEDHTQACISPNHEKIVHLHKGEDRKAIQEADAIPTSVHEDGNKV